MVVAPPVVESVHHDGDDVGLVPAHTLLPHPDGIVPALEVQVRVLLPPAVDVLRLLSNDISPKPEGGIKSLCTVGL